MQIHATPCQRLQNTSAMPKMLVAKKVTELLGHRKRQFPKLDVAGSNPVARFFKHGYCDLFAFGLTRS
jgi:hypothetical protein